MKKLLFQLLAAAFVPALYAIGIPLEWNSTYPTGVPREIEIDTAKMGKITGFGKNIRYHVVAEMPGDARKLDVTVFEGNRKDLAVLRFKVPAGTEKLTLVPEKGESAASDLNACDNIFAGAVDAGNIKKWHFRKLSRKPQSGAVTAEKHPEGILFEVNDFGVFTASYTVDVPENLAGKPVKLDYIVQSKSKMTWRNKCRISQLDVKGRNLGVAVTDPRFISHLRPVSTVTRYSEPGRIHPEAKKLVFEITFDSELKKNDNHGMPLKNITDLLPRLLVKRIALRPADGLPFPRYRDSLFGRGISGKPGDTSLRLTDKNCFFFCTTGQEVWAEGKQLRNIFDYFYTFGGGTVECFIKPEKWNKEHNILLQAANTINYVKGMYLERRQALFELSYLPDPKELTLYLKDNEDNVFKKSVKADLVCGRWYHIAAQWNSKNGVQLFIDGKRVLNDTEYKFVPINTTVKAEKYPNTRSAHQFTVGNGITAARGADVHIIRRPDFQGEVDLLRISSVVRYRKDFTPAADFVPDKSTRALFKFDRSFNGTTGSRQGFISGTLRDALGKRERKISYKGELVQYIPEKVTDDAHQDKVLCRLNYPVVPTAKDFKSSYRAESRSFRAAPGAEFTIDLDRDVRMDSIEITNTGKDTLGHPAVIRRGEVDPRSFGDIADTLDLNNTPHRERAYKIFNFLLGASDYYINYPVDFTPAQEAPLQAINLALVMLNSYCGFECGPLNNLAAIMFSCSGLLPASQTGGYAHSFEQVFYDGKNRVYDLSAQKFFPDFSNEGAASLKDIEEESAIINRTGSSPNHFIRLTTRNYWVNALDFRDKVGVAVKSGETLRIFFSNNGEFNDLNMSGVFRRKVTQDVEDYSSRIGVKSQWPIRRVQRPFPHMGSSFLSFSGKPSSHAGAFRSVTKESFCYPVDSSYVIVGGKYAAQLDDGSFADIELSVNGGKSFKKLTENNGKYDLKYEIMGHHSILFKINAPIAKVRNFTATTRMMTNPRVLTGKLVKGKNILSFKATSGSSADIKVNYSVQDSPIVISGGVYSGGIPGYERQLAAVQPGSSRDFPVTGISSKAKVSATKGLDAELKGGKLIVTADNDLKEFIGQVAINDRGREKRLTVISTPDVRLLLPSDAELHGKAKLVRAEGDTIQDCIKFDNIGDKAVFNAKVASGKYQIWNLNRFQSHITPVHGTGYKTRPLFLEAGAKESYGCGSTGNSVCDFYKAQFAKPGQRSRFKWDFPLTKKTTYPYHRPAAVKLKDGGKFDIVMKNPAKGGAELAAILIVPDSNVEFTNHLMRTLCGLNNEEWKITEAMQQ